MSRSISTCTPTVRSVGAVPQRHQNTSLNNFCSFRFLPLPTQEHDFFDRPQRLHLKLNGTSGHTWPFLGSPHCAVATNACQLASPSSQSHTFCHRFCTPCYTGNYRDYGSDAWLQAPCQAVLCWQHSFRPAVGPQSHWSRASWASHPFDSSSYELPSYTQCSVPYQAIHAYNQRPLRTVSHVHRHVPVHCQSGYT